MRSPDETSVYTLTENIFKFIKDIYVYSEVISAQDSFCLQTAVQGLHLSGILHNEIMRNIGKMHSQFNNIIKQWNGC